MKALDIDEIYRKHGHLVLRRSRRLLGDKEQAQDVLQEVFASLVQRPEQFAGQSLMTTWLYSATNHCCLNHIRNQKNRRRLLQSQTVEMPARPGPGSEQVAMAHQLLARMPEKLAQVAIYYYYDEMTHDEIAQVTGCTRRQVGKLLVRIHKNYGHHGQGEAAKEICR